MLAALLADEAVFPASPAHVPPGPSERGGRQDARRRRLFATTQAPRSAQLSLVVSEDNHTSRAHPAGGRRKLRPVPGNPRNDLLKGPLTAEIPAYSRSGRKRHDRPVTLEVAGSSPAAPVQSHQMPCKSASFVAIIGANDRRPLRHPAHIPDGDPRREPAVAGNTRQRDDRPMPPAVALCCQP